MKKILGIVLLFVFFSCSRHDPEDIVIDFKVQNMTLSSLGLLYNGAGNMIRLDKNGEATCVLKGKNNLYAQLHYGENAKQIFLHKGDRVTISFDARKFKEGIRFEGKNAPVVDYLNGVRYTELPTALYALPLEEFNQRVEEKIREATALLKARKLEATNPDFVAVEEGNIRYSYVQSLLMYPMGRIFVAQDTAYRPGEDYYGLLSRWMVEDEALVDVDAYQSFVGEAAYQLTTRGNEPEGQGAKTACRMKYIAENFTNEKVKQPLLNSLAIGYVERAGIRHMTEVENIYNAYVNDPALRVSYQEAYDRQDITAVGRLSPDFKAKDIEGKVYSLKDFKGKYLYIDLWATWCGPCRQELPALKELERKFEGKNIVFVGLSTDKDEAAWAEMVRSGELSGVQLRIGNKSEFLRAYAVEEIPRFILLDPEGKIVNAEMVRPSSPDTEKMLTEAVLPNEK